MDPLLKQKIFVPVLIIDMIGVALPAVGVMEVGRSTPMWLPDVAWRVELAWALVILGVLMWIPLMSFIVLNANKKKPQQQEESGYLLNGEEVSLSDNKDHN